MAAPVLTIDRIDPVETALDERPFPIPGDHVFHEAAFIEARDLGANGTSLTGACPEFGGFEALNIAYVWQRKGAVAAKRAVLGMCKPVGGLAHDPSGRDDTVVFAAGHCRDLGLTHRQTEALVYHEPCHVAIERDDAGRITPTKRARGVELFWDEVGRCGLWRADLRDTRIVMEQAPLPIGFERGT